MDVFFQYYTLKFKNLYSHTLILSHASMQILIKIVSYKHLIPECMRIKLDRTQFFKIQTRLEKKNKILNFDSITYIT